MDNNLQPRRIHPLIAAAAGSIIFVSLVGVAAITGVLPRASSQNAPPNTTGNPTQALSAAQQAQQQTQQQQQALQMQQATSQQQQQQQAEQARQAQAAAERRSPARPPQYAQSSYAAQPQATTCATCGTVQSIEPIRTQGQASGLGAVGGAVAGGLLGNQFGAGNGRAAMTVVGALGGGFAGNAVEKNVRSETQYRVYVRMDNGATRYYTYQSAPGVQPGERVRVEHGGIVRIG